MTNLTQEQILNINAVLNVYPSRNFVQALSNMGEQIYSITRSLGKQAKLGMTSIGMSSRVA